MSLWCQEMLSLWKSLRGGSGSALGWTSQNAPLSVNLMMWDSGVLDKSLCDAPVTPLSLEQMQIDFFKRGRSMQT